MEIPKLFAFLEKPFGFGSVEGEGRARNKHPLLALPLQEDLVGCGSVLAKVGNWQDFTFMPSLLDPPFSMFFACPPFS